jgi:hypothetical protein
MKLPVLHPDDYTPGITIADYYVRFAYVKDVTNYGETCAHCHEDSISANVHGTDLDGNRFMFESCPSCAMYVLRDHDTDPSRIVTIEVAD